MQYESMNEISRYEIAEWQNIFALLELWYGVADTLSSCSFIVGRSFFFQQPQ